MNNNDSPETYPGYDDSFEGGLDAFLDIYPGINVQRHLDVNNGLTLLVTWKGDVERPPLDVIIDMLKPGDEDDLPFLFIRATGPRRSQGTKVLIPGKPGGPPLGDIVVEREEGNAPTREQVLRVAGEGLAVCFASDWLINGTSYAGLPPGQSTDWNDPAVMLDWAGKVWAP